MKVHLPGPSISIPSTSLDTIASQRPITLVDLGAGTGTFTLAAAQVCRRVVAVDVSNQMLGVLLRKLDTSGVTNVEAVRAGFLTYGHRGEPADFVYTRHALHHLPDFFKVVALQRISRILGPGGVLCLRDLIYSFGPGVAEAEIERWVAGGTDDPAFGWTRDELEMHVREEFSTFDWLLEPMLEQAGFEIHDVQHQGSIYSRYMCIRK